MCKAGSNNPLNGKEFPPVKEDKTASSVCLYPHFHRSSPVAGHKSDRTTCLKRQVMGKKTHIQKNTLFYTLFLPICQTAFRQSEQIMRRGAALSAALSGKSSMRTHPLKG